jgi:hypothetical protein
MHTYLHEHHEGAYPECNSIEASWHYRILNSLPWRFPFGPTLLSTLSLPLVFKKDVQKLDPLLKSAPVLVGDILLNRAVVENDTTALFQRRDF